ncbi:hypothetical protein [Bosea sp. 2RAB26]|uniref:hypothetical protein n=1 Tax=Bosea sp. 2RAB26 TaxID=3237476 RepID=UPI003F8F6883
MRDQQYGARSHLALPEASTMLLLLQIAASHAEIGPFARRARETPQVAARRYEAQAQHAGRKRQRLVA